MKTSPLTILIITFVLTATLSAQEQKVQFAREIQPLLAKRCFACHGPDKAEGGLRFTSREDAIGATDSGLFAIVPSNAAESELLKRVTSTEEGTRMPPEGAPLTEAEQQLLRRWIEQGAEWQKHWAFEPITKPDVSGDIAMNPGKYPIDILIDRRLDEFGLKRNERAERIQLLRRVYFDLTGLAPTQQQIADFEKRADVDFSKAYEEEVDKLLASPQYGERWARHWLDVVRYAETNSFERDGRKPFAWRYRDYVIRSLNEDKPYDQFVREQLAGDELPEITRDSLVATGFYRLGIWDDEPADRELAVYEGYDDIITTVGQGLLGLTMNCSRCHDHKIDPIPTADYYSMLSFFRNVTPNGYGPNVERPLVSTNETDEYRAAEEVKRQRNDKLQLEVTKLEEAFREQLASSDNEPMKLDMDNLEYRFYRDSFQQLPNFDELKAETVDKLDPPLFDIRPATRPDHFGFVFVGTLIVPEDGKYQFLLDSDDGSRLKIDDKVILEYDGIHGEGSPKTAEVELKQGRRAIRLEYFQGVFGKGLTVAWSGPGFKLRKLSAGIRGPKIDLNQVLNSPASAELDQDQLKRYRELKKELEENNRQKPWEEYGLCVSEHGTNAPDTFILLRGNPQSQGEKVEPAFLSIFGSEKPEVVPNEVARTTGRRLALANWITSKENRLTSRVIVNRIWQHHFGRGIVRSPNNFGQLGEIPTHPELLDYLAADLMENGWKLKRLHKLIMLSATYQQSAIPSERAKEIDPSNNWFSHFNLRRLSAEEIRDNVLATTGTLNPKMYGPSIFPEISREVLAGQSVPGSGWERSSPEDQARRSIYIHVKRSLVVPILSSFDFPETDTSCEARFMTTQPGQALGMLNGDFFNQQAEVFAERLKRECGNKLESQVALGVELSMSRKATAEEIKRGLDLIASLRQKHSLNEDQALVFYCLYLFNLNEFIYVD